MKHSTIFFSAISIARLVSGHADPTPAALDAFDAQGWSPAPTAAANFDIFKRQTGANLNVCGYIGGVSSLAISCPNNRLCGFNTNAGWFGCCSSSTMVGTELEPAGCPVVTDCVDYASLKNCNGACQSNTLIGKCTAAASPYCAAYTLEELPLTAWACATTPFVVPVDLQPTGGSGGGLPSGSPGSSRGVSSFNLGGSVTSSTPSTSTQTTATTKSSGAVIQSSASKSSNAAAAPTDLPARLEVLGVAAMAVLNFF